jgi:hypothetical protein
VVIDAKVGAILEIYQSQLVGYHNDSENNIIDIIIME